MSNKRKDITKYIPNAKAPAFLTEAAEQELVTNLAEHGTVVDALDELTRKHVALSLASFLQCQYMKQSAWFKAQPAHTFTGLAIHDTETKEPRGAVRLAVRFEAGTQVVCSPAEAELPENYYEVRVVEETRILYKDLLK